jgi:hypothetical protein
MKNWLKKYFIPHEHNDYKPHILRREAMILMFGIIFFAEILFLVQIFVLFPNVKFFSYVLECVLIKETNSNRLADNLPTLGANPLLTGAAQAKADDMASKGYFAHTSPEGITPWYWVSRVGYQYSYAGENLAINFLDSKDVVDAWMNSADHRANILNNHFTEIGIGIAKGIYQNRETVFVVQMFGRPADQLASASPKQVAFEQQTFIAVKSAEVLSTETSSVKSETVKPETPKNLSIATFIGELVAAPRTRTETLYLIILAIISVALILNIIIKMKIQHPRIILNGILLILIINTVLLINHYLVVVNGKVF